VSAVVFASLSACSDDAAREQQITCSADELYDHVNDTCVPRQNRADAGLGDSGETPDGDSETTADTDISETPDADGETDNDAGNADAGNADAEDEDVVDPALCDKDNDGALAESCGGFDCDDDDPGLSPDYSETCDYIDNNCNGEVNEYIECTFYAHTPEKLFKIDPFAKTATEVHDVPGLQDIDTHPDGTLFGIKHDGLYHYDEWSAAWVRQGDYGIEIGDSNGLAIDQQGTAYITSDDRIYSADLRTGRATFVGTTGDFKSSGDCVVDKGNTLYMTSKAEGQTDTLVRVSRDTGDGTLVGAAGAVGFEKVYALTAAWGTLYGLTSNGELIEINRSTGVGTLIHQFQNVSFWGAASTPNR
jgi:hypothetical protein